MAKRSRLRALARSEAHEAAIGAVEHQAKPGPVEAFSFGDPEPVLDRRQILDMAECYANDRWYEPPVSREGLARAFRASAHHSSAIEFKRNLVAASLEPTRYLSRIDFMKAVQDYLIFGDAMFQRHDNVFGEPLRVSHVPAKYGRRGVKPGTFFFVQGALGSTEFAPNSVVQIMQPDINQEVYGVPGYLSALQSALLNEAATLFRRRYYLNGSHAGYILYATGDFQNGDTDAMRLALKNSKGPGNFRNLFVHAPGGKEAGIKVIPIAEVGAKDEFLGIKSATQADVLAAHRVPPQLLGIVPAQGSAFGSPKDATAMFLELEIEPIKTALLELNDRLGLEAIRYRERTALD
ncbi:phage portal protein [uncultured Sphingomonas sp.]|uniref:phage portal protein n=1 Tax=uncultured Sphingomonas sp. TaxID=158754 RepID=UPI0025FD37D7|nr:phage portal protein [uncultured Sphingomonas sp.]